MTLEEKLKDFRKDGYKEGIQENKIEMCKKLLAEGVAISIISKASGLSEEEILKLKTN